LSGVTSRVSGCALNERHGRRMKLLVDITANYSPMDDAGPSCHAGRMQGAHRLGPPVAGILLTGGTSRRMGFDKASIPIGGVPCAARVAKVLRAVVAHAVEVGPGISGLPAVLEEPPGGGPLVALCAGARALGEAGGASSALVLACDLPLITETVLRTLANWHGRHSVVPIIDGRPQPLFARWSFQDLEAAADLVAAGMRSMQSLLDRQDVEMVTEDRWPGQVDRRAFRDVDTPADLERLALCWDTPVLWDPVEPGPVETSPVGRDGDG